MLTNGDFSPCIFSCAMNVEAFALTVKLSDVGHFNALSAAVPFFLQTPQYIDISL